MVEQYVKIHCQNQKYTNCEDSVIPSTFRHRRGWIDVPVDGAMIYSHRNTYYTRETFTEGLHAHDYYEMIIYIGGDVEYINENTLLTPSPYTVIWFRPGMMHTARLSSASTYERYVFYFDPTFFQVGGVDVPMIDFIDRSSGFAMKIPEHMIEPLQLLLKKADCAYQSEKPYSELLLKAYLVELFAMLDASGMNEEQADEFLETMAEVKRYIDQEYATIGTISQIADRFFYSREHLSRKFKETFNIHISKYLSKRRIMESLSLLPMMNVADAAYSVGFRSQSSYIAAFFETMGCLPSEYKSKNKSL